MLWLKALHIISMVCWFAGLFYLPRLFVYHTQVEDAAGRERFAQMEKRLSRFIMTPASIATWVFGLWLLFGGLGWDYYKTQGWFHTKLTLVVLLTGYHHVCLAHIKRLANGTNVKSEKYFRIFNEIPVVFLIGIVILVVVRPF